MNVVCKQAKSPLIHEGRIFSLTRGCYCRKRANGHAGITAPWEIVMNAAGYRMMAYYRLISSPDLWQCLCKTLPELKTGFAGRKNWPVHIFAWHTIFNIHQRTVFLGSFWLCMVLVLTRVTKKLLMLHYMWFWSAYWWKKKKTEALLGSLKHQYVDRTYYGSTSLCWFAAVSLASICWF